MIKFFRKIRYKLMSENKTGRYFKYAIGEIILVVIGILIALQINNWNLDQQDRKVEKDNLLALMQEYSQNKAALQEVIRINDENIVWAEKLVQSYNAKVLDTLTGKTMAQFSSKTLGTEINFSPENGVLTEILSSGQLKLILNSELKHKLAGFNSKVDAIEQQELEVYDYRAMAIKDILQNGNMEKGYVDIGVRENYIDTNFKTTNKALSNYLPFLNKIIVYQASSNLTNIQYYKPLEEEIELILELIDVRLKEL